MQSIHQKLRVKFALAGIANHRWHIRYGTGISQTLRLLFFFCALGVFCGQQRLLFAQIYPAKTIRLIVPYPPGAFNDHLARTLSQKLSEKWKQPVLVDNRPGGGTIIATDMVARAPADGYTLLIASFAYSVNPALYATLPYDTDTAFTPVILAASASNMLVTHPARPFKSVMDLITAAKARPGTLNYASAGNGSSTHLCMELFEHMAGVDLVHIPYKGSAPAITDLIGGQVDLLCDNAPNALPHVRAGKLRALGLTGERRHPAIAEIPTIAESGVPGFEVTVWFGVLAPAGTPQTVITTLNAEINHILKLPEVVARFDAQGVQLLGGTSQDFAGFLSAQQNKWAKVVKDSGITAR